MSETRIEFQRDTMPQGYEAFSGLEYVEKEDGTSWWNGIVTYGEGENAGQQRIKVNVSPDVMWGHDPEDRKRYIEDPEKWEMQRQIIELTNRAESSEGRVRGLEEKLEALHQVIAQNHKDVMNGVAALGTPEPIRVPEAEAESGSEPVADHNEGTVDIESMEASMASIEAIQAEMESNPTPERMAELIAEFKNETRVMREAWEEGEPAETTWPGEPETVAITTVEARRNSEARSRNVFQRAHDWLRGRPPVDDIAVPVGAGQTTVIEEEVRSAPPERRGAGAILAAVGLGALTVGTTALVMYLVQRGHPPEIARAFCRGDHSGAGRDYFFHFRQNHGGSGKSMLAGGASHISLSGIKPHTIEAKTPNQFQYGVLDVLKRQGVHHHGVTAEKIAHMNHWMRGHQIASGMRRINSSLVQNLTAFPKVGHHFANFKASAEQGFKIGPGGNGHVGLDRWIREAERSGIRFSRS